MKSKKITKYEQDITTKMAYIQGKLNDFEAMCKYCASKLDIHIERLQDELHAQKLTGGEDEILLSIAGVKQVRDILKGTLKFSRNLLDEDKIEITDDHYKEEPCLTSPDYDTTDSAGAAATHRDSEIFGKSSLYDYKKRSKSKGFYPSSEESSPCHMSDIQGRVVELIDYGPQDQYGAAHPVEAVNYHNANSSEYRSTKYSEYGCHTHQHVINSKISWEIINLDFVVFFVWVLLSFPTSFFPYFMVCFPSVIMCQVLFSNEMDVFCFVLFFRFLFLFF